MCLTMWIPLCLLIWLSTTQATNYCEDVAHQCKEHTVDWTKCYEDTIVSCRPRSRFSPVFTRRAVDLYQEAEARLPHYRVHIPSSALQRSRGNLSIKEVQVVVSVINSTFFVTTNFSILQQSPPQRGGKSRMSVPSAPMSGTIMGQSVLSVKAGIYSVTNLPHPVIVVFHNSEQVEGGTCVYWEDSKLEDGTGNWVTDGCDTNFTGPEFICSCNHLSFFAVLVNPVLSVEKRDAVALSYITYIGSFLSVLFTIISLIIFIRLQRRRPEKAISIHMQLTGALLCLHLSFLLSSLWVIVLEVLDEDEGDWLCKGLGVVLHWSLLASFSWAAIEGFHLYLLLVRVFNIYIRRYMLKLSVVGWGLPTLTALVCGVSGVYGKYSLELRDGDGRNSTSRICWMSSEFPQRLLVSYITTVAFPCLVVLCNCCMLGLVVFKLWRLRRGSKSSSGWKKMNKEEGSRLWKDGATVLGLNCVLGLPWGLVSVTYISLPGIYVFTVLNSLQGVFMFLWSVALTCKSRSDDNSSVREPSTQKMMTTSFNS